MNRSLEPCRCRCCGLVPVWFGARTWCLCEPTPAGAVLSGTIHECNAERRCHRHRFGQLIVEEDGSGDRVRTLAACGCGQERSVGEVT